MDYYDHMELWFMELEELWFHHLNEKGASPAEFR